MLKAFLICTLFAFSAIAAGETWLGNWYVINQTLMNPYWQPPQIGSIVKITKFISAHGMLIRGYGNSNNTFKYIVDWAANNTNAFQDIMGDDCNGTLAETEGTVYANLTWSALEFNGMLSIGMLSIKTNWLGTWRVNTSTTNDVLCKVPAVGSQVQISEQGNSLSLVGTDSTGSKQTWTLNWAADNLTANGCDGQLCAWGNVSLPTWWIQADLEWSYSNQYNCSVSLVHLSPLESMEEHIDDFEKDEAKFLSSEPW